MGKNEAIERADVVMNISATYNNSSNSTLVTWEDEMNTDDPMNLTYLVSYNISVARCCVRMTR